MAYIDTAPLPITDAERKLMREIKRQEYAAEMSRRGAKGASAANANMTERLAKTVDPRLELSEQDRADAAALLKRGYYRSVASGGKVPPLSDLWALICREGIEAVC